MKALITTALVLASSAAFAAPSLTISGSASVKLGAGVTVRDHRSPAADDCGPPVVIAPTPTYQPVAYRPAVVRPAEPWFTPSNTRVSASGSLYTGSFGVGRLTVQRNATWYRAQTWFALTEATRIDNNREFFNIKQSAGYFSKIQLKNLGGRTHIEQVVIEYRTSHGIETQKVKLDTLLASSNPSLTINLAHNGKSIQRVIVYGDSSRGSAYQLFAL